MILIFQSLSNLVCFFRELIDNHRSIGNLNHQQLLWNCIHDKADVLAFELGGCVQLKTWSSHTGIAPTPWASVLAT